MNRSAVEEPPFVVPTPLAPAAAPDELTVPAFEVGACTSPTPGSELQPAKIAAKNPTFQATR